MAEKELTRAPGKRQIKPSTAILDGELDDTFGDEYDEDFTARDQSDQTDSDESMDSGESTGGYESGSESDNELEDEQELEEQSIGHCNDAASSSSVKHTNHRINGLMYNEEGIDTVANNAEIPKKEQPPICSVCLNLQSSADSNGEMIQCDKCGISVHEVCYGVMNDSGGATNHTVDAQSMTSSISTEPWFCEPCLFGKGIAPHCELCPSQYGAFKRSDVPGAWAHLLCALFTPGVEFKDPHHLSGVSWKDVDVRSFGRKPCAGCTDNLEARTGVTIRCDAGFCKLYYHVTCAQRLGLLVENSQDHNSSMCAEKGYINCKRHNQNELAISRLKNAYAKFIRQEDTRMVQFRNVRLDSRQKKKWAKQLQQRQNQFEQLEGEGQEQQKRAKLFQTSAKYLNAFAEKAEFLGMSRQQFEEEFSNVPPAQLPIGLPPAFSKAFLGYVEYRDSNCMRDEQEIQRKLVKKKAQLLDNQNEADEELQNVKTKCDGIQKRHATRNKLFERFKAVVTTLAPSAISIRKLEKKRSLPKNQTSPINKEEVEVKRKKIAPVDDAKEKRSPSEMKKSAKKSLIVPTHLKFAHQQEKPTNSSYLRSPFQNNIPTSLFSKFGFTDRQEPPQTSSSSKSRPNILKISAPPPKSRSSRVSGHPAVEMKYKIPQECNKCKKSNDTHLLIFCETCKHSYHIGCLDPPLERMPPKDKFYRFECSDCAYPSDDTDEVMEVDKPTEPDQEMDLSKNVMVTRRRQIHINLK